MNRFSAFDFTGTKKQQLPCQQLLFVYFVLYFFGTVTCSAAVYRADATRASHAGTADEGNPFSL